ncbi:hypothetical protein ACHQM5_005811 [Ranunculus cassubicifolius]
MFTSNSNVFVEDNNMFISQFSPTFLPQEDPFFQFLLQQQVMETINTPRDNNVEEENVRNKGNNSGVESCKVYKMSGRRYPKRRSGKKDRHSKIVTAQGTRDRRMRLSLEIASKFFNLQDMLGFDKASKTVDWLLRQSEEAINELTKGCVSSISDCELVSEMKGMKRKSIDGSVAREKKTSKLQSTGATRDSRVKARARARERTLEKKSKQCTTSFMWNSDIAKMQPNYRLLGNVQDPTSSSSICLIPTDIRLQHQLVNVNQFYGKPWESYRDFSAYQG